MTRAVVSPTDKVPPPLPAPEPEAADRGRELAGSPTDNEDEDAFEGPSSLPSTVLPPIGPTTTATATVTRGFPVNPVLLSARRDTVATVPSHVKSLSTSGGRRETAYARRFSFAKAVDSFRDRRVKSSSEKPSKAGLEKCTFECGYASLTMAEESADEAAGCWSEPVQSAMKAGECEQIMGKAAEDFLEGIGDKATAVLRRTMTSSERKDDEYFMYMRKAPGTKMVIVSVKCVENFLSGGGGRRVKWRNVSTGRVSIYRYSIAVIPQGFGTRVARGLRRHRKLCLILVWLLFVLLICLTVVLGSIGNDGPGNSTVVNSRLGR